MEELNPLDYLIDQEGINWKEALTPWEHLLPQRFKIWIASRFGDLFLELEDGALLHFDIQLGTVTKRGDSKSEFLDQFAEAQNAENWLYMKTVDEANTASLSLRSGQCYAFKVPLVLSGETTLENLCTVDIVQHYHSMAIIHQQIKDLPDGATLTVSSGTEEV